MTYSWRCPCSNEGREMVWCVSSTPRREPQTPQPLPSSNCSSCPPQRRLGTIAEGLATPCEKSAYQANEPLQTSVKYWRHHAVGAETEVSTEEKGKTQFSKNATTEEALMKIFGKDEAISKETHLDALAGAQTSYPSGAASRHSQSPSPEEAGPKRQKLLPRAFCDPSGGQSSQRGELPYLTKSLELNQETSHDGIYDGQTIIGGSATSFAEYEAVMSSLHRGCEKLDGEVKETIVRQINEHLAAVNEHMETLRKLAETCEELAELKEKQETKLKELLGESFKSC